jgi:hypothetical protein
MSVLADVATLRLALPRLHDDAYSPVKGIAFPELAKNTFNDAWWNERATTNPHLRHPVNNTTLVEPAGDQPLTGLFRATVDEIHHLHVDLVQVGLARHRAHAVNLSVLDRQLVDIAAAHIHVPNRRTDYCDDLLEVFVPLLERQGDTLSRRAHRLQGWAVRPERTSPCINPHDRKRCDRWPIYNRRYHLCASCYQHEAYLKRRAARRVAS